SPLSIRKQECYKRCPEYPPIHDGVCRRATWQIPAGSFARADRRPPRSGARFPVRTCVPKRSPPFCVLASHDGPCGPFRPGAARSRQVGSLWFNQEPVLAALTCLSVIRIPAEPDFLTVNGPTKFFLHPQAFCFVLRVR